MSTLLQRIELILAQQAISARELARRAGLAEAYVSIAISRLRKNPDANIGATTLRKLARGGNVSVQWLLTGAGTPDSIDSDAPSVTTAVMGHAPIYANAEGWDDAVRLFELTPEGQRTPKSVIHAASQHAPYELHGPVTKDIVAALVRLVIAETDPAKALQRAEAAEARVAQLEEWKREMEAGLEEFERQKAELLAGKKPKKGGRG